MLYANARAPRPPSASSSADGMDPLIIKNFQRLERVLNDVKSLYSTHESPETRKLYDLFAEYGGPVQVVLEFSKGVDCTNAKVYQVLRDIVSRSLYQLTCKVTPGQDSVHTYADLGYQWEQLLKAAPQTMQRTLTDNFQGLIRELQQPRPSLERLEIVIRRVGFVLDFQLPSSLPLDLHSAGVSRAITPPTSSIYSMYPHDLQNEWLPRTELPRRPFKSRECDFYKQGKCSKEMCSFAHGNSEKEWWTQKYQSMMPCKTPGCVGRASGCLYSHAPDEQNHSRRDYEDVVAQATSAATSSAPSPLPDPPAFSPYIVDTAAPTPSVPRQQWLGKNELPRPFRSKLCDFFATNGVCAKQSCNYAHEPNEMVMWSNQFQTMFRCNTKGCPGRANGCTFSHTPEEQLASRAKYEDMVDHARSISDSHWDQSRSPRSEISML